MEMAVNASYRVPFRRRREGRTNYRLRGRLIKSGKPRACVRNSLRHSYIQLINYGPQGDRVVVSATSRELENYGWQHSSPNVPTAYLTGLLAARKAKAANITEAVLDIGIKMPTKGNRTFAGLKGLIDGGMDIPHGEDILPDDDRLAGAHIGPDVAGKVEEVKKKIMEG
jgi:large subunit ribosomal protein L18